MNKIIGKYYDKVIYETINHHGKIFNYNRIALQDDDGRIDLEQLSDDEVVCSPGLIYKMQQTA